MVPSVLALWSSRMFQPGVVVMGNPERIIRQISDLPY